MHRLSRLFSEYFQIFLGIVLASLGLKAFLLPNGFLDGGATGIAILLSELFGWDISWLILIISVPFLVMAWFTISRKAVYKSIFSILGLAIFIHFENFEVLTEDKLLISIFGGVFLGAGIGLTVKNGAVLDGAEILGVYIHDRYGISIGRVVLVFNVILFGITAFFLSLEVAMYSVLTYLVTAKVIDFLIEGFEDYVGLMVVSKESQILEHQLIRVVGSGITVYQGARGYGKRGIQEQVNILHLVINRIDIRKTYNVIDQVDPQAFIIEFDVNSIRGGVFRRYLSREKTPAVNPSVLAGIGES
jgi:uncharacterized membrane-anchored protein YitT (DUF2179 family)